MRLMLGFTLLAGVLFPAHEARAQSESAVVGWIGLITTPVGAFAPVAPAPVGRPGVGVQGRISHWEFGPDDDNTNNFGLGLVLRRERFRTTFEVGQTSTKDCSDCSMIMLGVDSHVSVTAPGESGGMAVALNPAIGMGRSTGANADGTSLAVALSLPLAYVVHAGSSWRVTPFVSPGFGFARLSGGGFSDSGSRAMASGGVGFGTQRVQFTASARKIFIEDGATVFGVSFALGQ